MNVETIFPLRDRLAAGLMLVAAFGAGYAFVTAVMTAGQADLATRQVEWWRALGFTMFAAIFVLLAFWPRRYPFLWELVLIDKAVLTGVEIFLSREGAANAAYTAVADGVLTGLIFIAYLLSKGYLSWKNS